MEIRYCIKISVPIDGCNEQTHDKVRAFAGSFRKITRENYTELEGIAELLNQYPIAFWHIYDFIPIGRGKQYRDDLYINREEYKKIYIT